MKISVIVPVYNVELYLSECIDSVLSQTYKNYEVILVDDGSTDKSGIICDQYSSQHPEIIKTVHTSNMGVFSARIEGIQRSNGDILMFLDSDDTIRKDALEMIYQCFTEHICDMVMYNAGNCNEFLSKPINMAFTDGQAFENNTKKLLYQNFITDHIPNCVWSKAIKKSCVDLHNNISQFNNVKYGEDLLLSAFLINNCEKIVYLNQDLYNYRVRSGSAVHSYDAKRKESVKIVHTELEKYIDKWGMLELKPLHNARKVKGWIEIVKLLIKNKKVLPKAEFKDQLKSMSVDPYFQFAYDNMDSSQLALSYRISAFCLAKRLYLPLSFLFWAKQVISKK